MSVAEFSLRRPVTTVMLFVSLFVVGLIASFRLPLEALPDVSAPFLFVQLPYEGSTPEEVERNVLRPAEEALATMTGVKRMRGEATANGAGVFMEFSDWDRDIAITASEARERLDAIRQDLPDDFRRYFVFKWSTGDQAILRVRLAGDVDLSSSYDLIDRQLKRRIERVPGVARVEINGAPANEVEIAIDPDRLNAHGIALNALAERLRTVNFSVSAGMIEDGGVRLRVQPQGEVSELAELRDLVVDASGLRLGDVATVQLKPERVDVRRRLEGRAAVGLEVYKERDANLVEVSRNAMAEMRAAGNEPGLEGVEFKVLQDMGESVTSSLLELAEAGAIGLLLSILVLFFFLRHWPSTLMVTLAIPICFVMTLGFMHFFGVTLNILSLMGLLLAVGMLVDNAVVVVESIYQERERNPGDTWRASIVGTRNVAIALSAGTLCHCIVFLPNLLGETNDISIFMAQIAITISVSLLASWLVAVSLIPMLSARMPTPPALAEKGGMIRRMQGRYARLLRWTLVHRGWSVAGIVLVIAASVVPIKGTTFDMFGGGDQGELNVYYQWKGSYTTAQMSEEIGRVEDFLDQNRERFRITQIYSWFGEDTDSGTMLTFDDDVKDTSELAEAISKALPRSARAEIGVRGNGGQGGGGGGLGKNVSVQLVGDSAAQLRDIADDVVPMLEARPGLRDVRVDQGDRGEELAVRVDRERAAAFGFSAEQVSSFVAMALRGSQLREYRRGDAEVPVWVRFEGAQQYQPSDIAGFMVRSPDGRQVPLLAMVDMEVQPTDSRIARHDRQTAVGIQANLEGETTMEEARNAMESVIDSLSLPAGYGHSFSGSGFEDDQKAMQQMLFNLVLALLMIYVVMAAVFESLLFPAAIMSCVLFSILGVFWLFWLTGTSFTVMGFIGILVLMGVVVNNGIVMVEHINNLRRRGMSRTDALVEGSRERLRPILMTMGTAILAMVPISLSDTVVLGGLAYSPMARAVAGGLAFSTVVSLLFLPTIYAMLDDLANGSARLLRRARAGRGGPASAEQLAEHP
ncbi:efflux RND transporter permease subunit [Luteimonas sp. MC1782]|uniref:efflux RND transporter permease subunit n=1 Tax=Luteimonas sp. MC1782 TaxID=2760305 RepID=UPI0016041740|nr:efflux RND transporter permease subunit [Luteimonas sp. MC1782]MBB1472046.1 efflux RND transporter permease subunit [Luteimonas sp. MC1782]